MKTVLGLIKKCRKWSLCSGRTHICSGETGTTHRCSLTKQVGVGQVRGPGDTISLQAAPVRAASPPAPARLHTGGGKTLSGSAPARGPPSGASGACDPAPVPAALTAVLAGREAAPTTATTGDGALPWWSSSAWWHLHASSCFPPTFWGERVLLSLGSPGQVPLVCLRGSLPLRWPPSPALTASPLY